MIPDSVTQADLERWREDFERTLATDPAPATALQTFSLMSQLLPGGFTSPPMEEIHMAGCWLGEQLEIAGAGADMEPVIVANGQKTVFAHIEQKDAWDIAQETLESYKAGNWDRPGPELADQLNDKFLRVAIDNSKRRN